MLHSRFLSAVVAVCLAMAAAGAAAQAFRPFVVKDIRVEGLQRTEPGTIFSYLPVKVGESMNEEKAQAALRALYATGFFSDVRLEVDNDVLQVFVQERPAVAQIAFSGMKEFEPEAVRKVLRENGLAEGRIFDRSVLDTAEQEIKKQYLSRGLYAAEEQTTVTPPERKDIYITVNVNEGERYTVSDVQLSGQMLVPREQLEKLIQLKPGDVFSREKLAASTKAISDRLGNDGYAFANANAIPNVDKEKRSVAFNIVIDPGRRVYVRRIDVAGNTKTRDEVVRRAKRQHQ